MDSPEGQGRRKPGRLARAVYRAVGGLAMLLAAAGVALPGLPTTPFLLVALWAFTRGAQEWADRLRAHRRYGPFLRNWEERQAIPRPAKVAAGAGMAASWGLLAATSESLILVVSVGAGLVCVLVYVVSRPRA